MKIHFVCTSNTFRSRLAESYLKSKNINDIEVSSSGVQAYLDPNGPITWYAQRIIEEKQLVLSEKGTWTQTTKDLLEAQDLVIFMQKWHYEQCIKKFGFAGRKFEVWNVDDIASHDLDDEQKIDASERIFITIKNYVDDLVSRNFKSENP